MIKEFSAFFDLFKKGKELTNSGTWKNRQIATGALTTVLGAAIVIANGFGYPIVIDEASIQALAGGLAAAYGIFNSVMTAITSAKVGIDDKDTPA